MEGYLTTGAVAKMCGVSPRTVAKWFDDGVITGCVIPQTTHRRIDPISLEEFMRKHNMPRDGFKTQRKAKARRFPDGAWFRSEGGTWHAEPEGVDGVIANVIVDGDMFEKR